MTNPPIQKTRLGIIHLLGWMAGVGVAVGIYTNFTDWSAIKPEDAPGVRLAHLAFGLCYGTALAGLVLVLWRRFVLRLSFPAQPGHWLLVFAAAGFILVGATDLATRGMQWLGWIPDGAEQRYYAQLAEIWFIVFAGSIIAIGMGGRLGHWRWLAMATGLLALANCLTSLAAQLVFYSTARAWMPFSAGNWPYFAVHWTRGCGAALYLPLLALTALFDRHDRDWLHFVGVVVVLLLGLVEAVQVAIVIAWYR